MKRNLINIALLSACFASTGNAISMEAQQPFEIVCRGTAAENGPARINIYDRIGNSLWEEGITAKQFCKELSNIDSKAELSVHISSDGGNTMDGTVMYNELLKREGVTNTYIDGYAISMASVIAMAGKNSGGKTVMASNGLMMIHKPLTAIRGNADQLRAQADVLDKAMSALMQPYIESTGKSEEEISALLAATTWMDADEALEMGFISEISEAGSTADVDNCINQNWIEMCDDSHKAILENFIKSEASDEPQGGAEASGEDDADEGKPEASDEPQGGAEASGEDNGGGTQDNPVVAERKRCSDIQKMCNNQGFPEKAQMFIDKGYSLEMAQEFVMSLKASIDESIDGSSGGGNSTEASDKSGGWKAAYDSVVS